VKRTQRAKEQFHRAIDAFENHGQAAKACGVAPSYISMLLRGRRIPSLPVAVRIAKATGLPLETVALATVPEAA
jgi:transcriptional regulator with XRE-family HTH domain